VEAIKTSDEKNYLVLIPLEILNIFSSIMFSEEGN